MSEVEVKETSPSVRIFYDTTSILLSRKPLQISLALYHSA